jgi:photosystem II stability/assembly factor-like uncharacterized protein
VEKPTSPGVGPEGHPRVADLATLQGGVILVATPLGLYRSADAGLHWQRSPIDVQGPVSAMAKSADDPRLVLLATRAGFWLSGDAGATWRSLAAPKGAQVNSVAILRGEPRVIFAGRERGALPLRRPRPELEARRLGPAAVRLDRARGAPGRPHRVP